jgi:anthranilate synthase component 1
MSSARRHRILPGTTDLLAIHANAPLQYPFLLESVSHGPNGRFDILFAAPLMRIQCDLTGQVRVDGAPVADGFLKVLRQRYLAERHADDAVPSLPFRGGWFVILGYELAREIEPQLAPRLHEPAIPIALAVRIPAAIIQDHELRQTHLICEPGYEQILDSMESDLQRGVRSQPGETGLDGSIVEEPAAPFLDGVQKIKAYIRAGDVFQVNLSRQWRMRTPEDVSAVDIYARLRRSNPAPFAALARVSDDIHIVSSSPERLVTVRGSNVSTRPIAGTHPRDEDAATDAALAQAMIAHPKERAEHIMLIDLERNDLGRICRPGSVHVPELMTIESYRHVHHIVSEVRGELAQGIDPVDVIRATFPGGTITGCPKVRCMEIIAELETEARGAYTGSLGYINHDGSMDLNILIRTLVMTGQTITLRAGAGIVADSDPERELQETRAKARGLLRALGAA